MNEVMKINRVGERKESIESLSNRQTSSPAFEEVLNTGKTEEEALIKTVMEKEAEWQKLNKANKQLKKESNQIKQSRTWKIAAPLRKLSRFVNFLRKTAQGAKNVEELRRLELEKVLLESENHIIRKELKLKQEKVSYLTMESSIIHEKNLHRSVKNAKKNGEIIEYINNLIVQKQIIETNYNNKLLKAARLFQKEPADFKQVVYSEVLSGLKVEDVPEFIIRFAGEESTLPIKDVASFSASLTGRARIRQLRDKTPEQLLDNKRAAYKLMDRLATKRPWIMEKGCPFKEIPKKEAIAIKPIDGAGSRGVYLVFRFDKIQDVKRSRMLTSWDALRKSIKEDLASEWVRHDEWMVEELIVKNSEELLPAKDLKFYCFYGKVALILEIDRFPELRYCWWTPDGKRIRTGKYDDALFHGEGISIEEIEDAKSISEQLPLPFIRIDFLKTDQGMCFGEFTPKPGNYETFNRQTDRWLGDYYLDAEGRLSEDLLKGKQFEAYKDWIMQLE